MPGMLSGEGGRINELLLYKIVYFRLLVPSEPSGVPVSGLLSAASAALVCRSGKNPAEKCAEVQQCDPTHP